MKNLGGQVCQICEDNVGKTVDGEPFIACHVCAFPVCGPCYEYEMKDGNQSCPQCKTRYKRHKGWFDTIEHYLNALIIKFLDNCFLGRGLRKLYYSFIPYGE